MSECEKIDIDKVSCVGAVLFVGAVISHKMTFEMT